MVTDLNSTRLNTSAEIDNILTDETELQQFGEDANLSELYRHRVARRYLSKSTPDPSALKVLVKDAERILLDGLVDGSDKR